MLKFLLCVAILIETIATTFLKLSDGFTKPLFSFITILGYIVSFYLLSIIVKELPIGIVYAVWSGMGIILISFIDYFLFEQSLNISSLTGIAFIIIGVVLVNFYST
ncbi:TPA: multidrug efflux SMR transporter [Acinetobacter baumannii]|uniref:DMT family transporter n=1 Tax=Acinetobacter baumannii TaxID=470 RepID=UPI0004154EFE|nr:multidrug efflux SMR transporter [Acinetobacter baumannii]MCF1332373.1 multidrug efflux SMR transporter [Acinetobacter baumannii]MCP9136277.1 multidrug efflux SMR transporter [Acinetobacter baumannii]MDC4652215.1 multidrug efflux SMR transporter [Acinetobacter baumannii]MDV7410504.1 multidrug efflux SMR transporter [Acinetobacter baumannii]MDW3028127.1 multidrug efflux SMR transporter [Acinetobacter baumannii]